MTVVGKGEKEQSELMMRAAQVGRADVNQAHGELMAEKRAGQERFTRMGTEAAGLINENEARKQQGQQFDAKMAEDKRQFDVTSRQRDDQTSLEAAKSGFEENPKSDRASQLEQEMARGASQPPIGPLETESQNRLRQQGSQPLEHQGRWRATEARQQEEKRKNFEADTERIRAESYRDQVGAQAQKARASGDAPKMKELHEALASPVNDSVKNFDRMMKGEARESDWGDLAEAAGEGDQVEPGLDADIKAKNWTPRVQQFARSQISKEAIKYVIRTGDTAHLKVDWTSPKMRAFTEQLSHFNALAKSMGPEFSKFAGINTVEDKMTFLNTQAAMAVYMGMDQAPAQSAPLPSAGGPQQQQPPAPAAAPMAQAQQNPTQTRQAMMGPAPSMSDVLMGRKKF